LYAWFKGYNFVHLDIVVFQNCVVPENNHTSPHSFKFLGLPEPPIPQEILIPSLGESMNVSGIAHYSKGEEKELNVAYIM